MVDFGNYLYEDIEVIEVAISAYSGEGLRMKIDKKKSLINWNDGYMWNNNFMKGLNDKKRELIETKLPSTKIIEFCIAYRDGRQDDISYKTFNPAIWAVELRFSDGEILKAGGDQDFPNTWLILTDLIEEVTECSFKLR